MNKINDLTPTGENLTQAQTVRSLAATALEVLARRDSASNASVSDRIRLLSDAFLSMDPDDAKKLMDRMVAEGLAIDDIIDHVLPEVARRLGDRWFADDISFADVSIGTARLQEAIRELRAKDHKKRIPLKGDARVLLVIPSPEDHTFGVFVAADQLRRLGLIVEISIAERRTEFTHRVSSKPYKMIGITASGVRTLASVKEMVTTIRRHSQGFVPIAVGGPVAETNQSAVQNLSVDLIGTDIREAAKRFGLLAVGANEDVGVGTLSR